MSKLNEMNLLLIKRDLLIEKQKIELESLKLQFEETRKAMSLTNIVKSTFDNKDLKENLITIAMGLATNYLIDKFPFVAVENKFTKIINRLFKFNK
jgi:hypothetical protein